LLIFDDGLVRFAGDGSRDEHNRAVVPGDHSPAGGGPFDGQSQSLTWPHRLLNRS
jgi:hypothetical protein